jgi:flagellar basal-body rod modification protein FlgD
MSAISSGIGASATKTVDPSKAGFNSLTADDFLTLLIAQLQNQDPTEPVDNAEILNQLATMQGLTSNIELSDTLKDVAASLAKNDADFGQKLSVGASYIGQTVTLDDSSVGVVDRAFLAGGETFVGINGVDVPISRVVAVNSSQSYVGQLVAVDAGNGETELGTVRGILNRSGKDFLQFETVDNSGVVERSEIEATKVKNVLSVESLEGKQVQAVTTDGRPLNGPAIVVSTSGLAAQLLIQGIAVTLDRIVGVALE